MVRLPLPQRRRPLGLLARPLGLFRALPSAAARGPPGGRAPPPGPGPHAGARRPRPAAGVRRRPVERPHGAKCEPMSAKTMSLPERRLKK